MNRTGWTAQSCLPNSLCVHWGPTTPGMVQNGDPNKLLSKNSFHRSFSPAQMGSHFVGDRLTSTTSIKTTSQEPGGKQLDRHSASPSP